MELVISMESQFLKQFYLKEHLLILNLNLLFYRSQRHLFRGKNLNQLVRYTHQQANANHPIDTLNLALAIDNMAEQLAELKAHYQVEKNYFNGVEDEDTVSEDSDPLLESSTLENSTFNNDLTG